MAEGGIGASLRRKEDPRFLTGRGNYTDDINRPGQTWAAFVRSPHAHARILKVKTDAARKAPGVVTVLTGADLAADKVGILPAGWLIHSKDGSPMVEPGHAALVADKVRHVGDQVAVVVAETRDQAREAAALVEVEYQELPAVVSVVDAIKPGAPLVHDQAKNNTCYDWHLGDKAATDAAFAKAHKVVTLDLVNNRLIPNAIEPRSAIGDYDKVTGELTLFTSSQNPHLIRLLLAAFTLGVPEHKLRVIAPDVGGGFGSKIFHYAEDFVVLWAARKVGRPVKWTATRSESFMSDAHGRDHVTHCELALDKDGRFLGLRERTLASMGGYLSQFAPSVPTYLHATLLAGCYTTPAIYSEVRAVFTHTVPVDAYRGAGRPEASYLLERIIDVAAREMGIDRVEIRRRNFIPADKFPYQTPVALQYDSGNYQATLETALKKSDWAGFEKRRAEAKKRGKLRGIGIGCYLEVTAPANKEMGGIRFEGDGSVTIITGTLDFGQGHATAFAQVLADNLGIPFERIRLLQGDSDQLLAGGGTGGSRSLMNSGAAIIEASAKVIEQGKRIAAVALETAAADIEFMGGQFVVAGTDRAIGIMELADKLRAGLKVPDDVPATLDVSHVCDGVPSAFPNGCHVAEVEIDPDSGITQVVKYSAVNDFGNVINPLLVDGQIHGGVVQGIGQALTEQTVYDSDGQLLSGSLMDYALPRAGDAPDFTVVSHPVPAKTNPLGVKGCGEAGCAGGLASVMNAVVDALSPLGIRHIDMPATPRRVWQAIQDAKGKAL